MKKKQRASLSLSLSDSQVAKVKLNVAQLHCNVACSLPVGSFATESAYQISEFKLPSYTSSKDIHVNSC